LRAWCNFLQTYTYDIRPIKDNSVSQPLMVMATNAAAPAKHDRGNTVPDAASSMTTANGSNVHSYEVSWTAVVDLCLLSTLPGVGKGC